MLLKDTIKLSTRMFKTNPSRTWLTIMGMGVGIGAVVILVGFGFGLQGVLLEQIVFGETLLSLNVTNPPSEIVMLTPQEVQQFLDIPGVLDVAPLAQFSALITYEGLTGGVLLQGVNAAYFRYAGVPATHGRLFEDDEFATTRNEIIISSAALQLFNVQPEEILGDTVTFRVAVPRADGGVQEVPLRRSYKVVGVTDNLASIEVFIPLPELEAAFAISHYERVQARTSGTDVLDSVQEEIVERGFRVAALSKTIEQANKIFQGVQAVLAVFGGIALVVSAIGMFNTMTVTLLERTAEIGIMRTIGASPKDIKILFLSEAVVVGFLGGVIGILMGLFVGGGLNLGLNFLAARFGGVAMSLFRFPILFLMFILSFSMVVGFITGLFPAKRAASLNPLDAIRYK